VFASSNHADRNLVGTMDFSIAHLTSLDARGRSPNVRSRSPSDVGAEAGDSRRLREDKNAPFLAG
jgi:hypothetical protein